MPQYPVPLKLSSTALTALDAMGALFHDMARDKGFWDKERNPGEMIALMHSELSEMLEGVRKPGPDQHCPDFTSEEVEAADLFIRLMDYAWGRRLRFADALQAKYAYNATRPHKHGKEF